MSVCGAITRSGSRCKGTAIAGSDWCYNHHPDHARKRQRDASKGGKRGGRGRPSTVLQRLQARLEELAEMVLKGEVEQDVASTAGRLLNYSGNQVRHYLSAKEQEELVERLEALEQAHERTRAQQRGGYAR